LKDLVLGQAKINESITKKLTFNDKMIENINSKLEGLTSSVKNQLSFNKMIKTHKLLKLPLPFLLIMKERSRDNPRILLKKDNVVTTRGGKSTRDPPNPNHKVGKA
jgi:hypothetical protein